MAESTQVLNIKVNDEEFKEYLTYVQVYKDLLAESGIELANSVAAAGEVADENFNTAKEELEARKKMVQVNKDLAKAGQGEVSQGREVNRNLADRKRLLAETNQQQKENIGTIRSFASSSLGKMMLAGGFVWGGAKLAGKAYNAITNLSQEGMQTRTATRLSGMDAGHLAAWQRNLSPYDPNGALLDTARQATRDGALAARLQAMGVDTSSGDASKILASLVPALRNFRNQHQGATESQTFASLGMSNLQDVADVLGRAGDKEVAGISGNVERDARRDAVSDAALAQHQNASLDAGRRRDQWTATKLTALAPVAEKMAQGAEKAQEKLDDLAISAVKASSALDKFTGGNGALVTSAAAALAPSVGGLILKKGLGKLRGKGAGAAVGAAARAAPGAVGGIMGRAGSLLGIGAKFAGPIGALYGLLHPAQLGADDTTIHNHPLPGTVNGGVNGPIDLDKLTGAVAMTESHGDPNARSGVGAMGLMQLMPRTAQAEGVTNPYDPIQSWNGGKHMLQGLLRHNHGDLEKSLAGYNWGQGNVDKAIKQLGDRWKEALPAETRNYLPRVMGNLQRGTVVRIENYSGQDMAVASRQAAT